MKLARAALAAGACVWLGGLFLAPHLLFPLGRYICHQRPERSFFVSGYQLPVCARCTGLYLGAAFAAPIALAVASTLSSWRARLVLGVTALPTLVTWTLEFAGIAPFSNSVRFAAALPLGFTAAWLVFSTLAEPAP